MLSQFFFYLLRAIRLFLINSIAIRQIIKQIILCQKKSFLKNPVVQIRKAKRISPKSPKHRL